MTEPHICPVGVCWYNGRPVVFQLPPAEPNPHYLGDTVILGMTDELRAAISKAIAHHREKS